MGGGSGGAAQNADAIDAMIHVDLPLPRQRSTPRLLLPLVIVATALATGSVVAFVGPIAVVAPFALIAGVWVWVRMPGVLLAAYLFLPFYKAAIGPLSPVDLTPLLAAANATQVILLLSLREWPGGSRLGLALWATFGVLVLAGVTWAGQQSIATEHAAFWWLLILLPSVAAIRVASSSRYVDQFLGTGFAIGCLIVVLGLPALVGVSRLAVIGQNTLQTGSITLIAALLSVFWVLRVAPLWARPLAAVLIVVAIAESLASGSRGPLLAFLVALGFGFANRVLSGRAISRHDLGLAALATSAIGVLLVIIGRLPEQAIARLLMLGEALSPGGSAGTSVGARIDLFNLATQMFVDRPILGTGTGAFAAFTSTRAGLSDFTYPHNNLLQIAAEFGVIGVALFLALVALALLRKAPASAAWTSVRVIFVFALTLSFTSGDIYGDRLLWGLLVLILSAPVAVRYGGREAEEPPIVAPFEPTMSGAQAPGTTQGVS